MNMKNMDHSKMDHSSMFFSNNMPANYLFEKMTMMSATDLYLYCFLTIVVCVFLEFTKSVRISNKLSKLNFLGNEYNHLFETFLMMLQTTLGYFMMLVAMLFNWTLFASVIVGTGIGFY